MRRIACQDARAPERTAPSVARADRSVAGDVDGHPLGCAQHPRGMNGVPASTSIDVVIHRLDWTERKSYLDVKTSRRREE